MESNPGLIKDFYRKEISLFRELLHYINMERENLIQLDIKGLWAVMEKKQEVLNAIEATKEERKEITGDKIPYSDLHPADRQKIMEFSKKLSTLKEDIKRRVAENISFINESLGFFREIFSIFTGSSEQSEQYGPLGKNRPSHPSRIYRNEV